MARPRRLVSYRLSLVVAIPLLIVMTGALIAGNAYFTTRNTIDSLTTQLFDQVSEQTADEASNHVGQAVPAVDLVAGLLRDEDPLPDQPGLAQRLLQVLRANPGFAWVSFSETNGDFTGVYRTASGEVRTNRSSIHDGKTELYEHVVHPDDSLTLLRHVQDTGYDPRTRPFYELAVDKKRRVWTPPYVFFDQGIPGITCAEPVYGKDGALRGVVTVDFDLNVLSQFVAGLHLSPHALIFIYTPDGTILAHPTLHLVEKKGAGSEGELVTAKNVADPLVRDFLAHAPHGAAAGQQFTFRHDGQDYFGATRRFDIDHGLSWVVGAAAPQSDFLHSVQRNNRIAAFVSLGAVALALLLGAALANRVAVPLARIAKDMDRVGRFDLGEQPATGSMFREIDAMGRSLSAMKGGLRSFASYVPRDLVRAVLASGEEAKLGGRTRVLTVFFSDLAGFTTISESMAPEALVELLGGYLDEMTRVISKHGGTVDKFIGDGIMAFWGAPGEEPRHAERAVEAAIAAQRALAAMKRDGDEDVRRLSMRIGLATGEVVVGNIGAHDRMNYTVMGDTVNLAARLEGLNKQYGTPLMISEATYLACKEKVVARPIDVVAVKGKRQGVRVYEPLCLCEEPDEKARGVAEASERALDLYLHRRFDEAAAAWDEVLHLRPGDAAASHMKRHAQDFAKHPPPEDWDGVAVMKVK